MDCFGRLPEEVREQARRAYRLWRTNPSHPGLRFKPIHRHADLYSVRVGRGWRALGRLHPSWSADGKKIVFASARSGNYDVWSMDADGRNPVNLRRSQRMTRIRRFRPTAS